MSFFQFIQTLNMIVYMSHGDQLNILGSTIMQSFEILSYQSFEKQIILVYLFVVGDSAC